MSGVYRAAGYGVGRADSGYGHGGYGVSRYVDCNSALALLGFILFIDLLRDIIEDVTEDAMATTRKKRWTVGGTWDTVGGGGSGSTWDTEPDILTFINKGGPDHLYQTLPHILKPLMVGWTELGGEGEEEGQQRQCLEQSVCQANWVLSSHYGTTGRVLATLLSNVASRALSRGDKDMLWSTLAAAREGRRRHQPCEDAFPSCPALRFRHTQPLYSTTNTNTTTNTNFPHTHTLSNDL